MTINISTGRYLRSQVERILRLLVLAVLIYIIVFFFFNHIIDPFIWPVVIVIIMQLFDIVRVYRVNWIRIDSENNECKVGLKSILSGMQTRSYSLSQVETMLTLERRWLRPGSPKPCLIIKAGNEETYHITDSMGMSIEEMRRIDEEIKKIGKEHKDYLTSF